MKAIGFKTPVIEGLEARRAVWFWVRLFPFQLATKIQLRLRVWYGSISRKVVVEEGQGTTEYAILVGVLVVIAIAAVRLFRGRLESLWGEIANGINSL